MIFRETPIFTKQVLDLLPDDQYRLLQKFLVELPDAGSSIKGAGGLRKLRWHPEGKGKRGGVRVIYYRVVREDIIFMIYMYSKIKQANLTPDQLKKLKRTVEKELDNG